MATDDPCPKCGVFLKAHPPSGKCPPKTLDGGRLREVYERLTDKFEGDLHRQAASEMYGVPVHQVTPDQRSAVKNAAFALRYSRPARPETEPPAKAFEALEVLQWEERRSSIREADGFLMGDGLLTMMVRFPGGKPFQVVVSGQTGRDEIERMMTDYPKGDAGG